MSIADRPGRDWDSIVFSHGMPLSRSCSSGVVISCSTSSADSPSASVCTCTAGGSNSGYTSSGAPPSWVNPSARTATTPASTRRRMRTADPINQPAMGYLRVDVRHGLLLTTPDRIDRLASVASPCGSTGTTCFGRTSGTRGGEPLHPRGETRADMTSAAPPRMHATVVADIPVALLVAVLQVIGSGISLEDDWQLAVSGGQAQRWLPDGIGLLLLLAGSLPLAFRRIAPLPVLALSAAASVAYHATGHRPEPLPLGVLVALYTVAVMLRPVVCNVAAGTYVLAMTLGTLTGWLPFTDDQFYIDLVLIVATVMLGYGVALSRARATLAEQQAAAMAHDLDVRTRAAVETEQARIAREVHHIIAHDVRVIGARASSARRVFAAQPQTAADALASIEAVGRDALDGLRRLFGLLRTHSAESDRSPQPSLDRLPWLLAQVERAGLPVDLTIRGKPAALSATVELNAFRIVQEALTNILKHAGPTRATVVLDYDAEALGVEVRDDGTPQPASQRSPGYGLISMQQRVTMLGGELVAGPETERGFRVSARLPLVGSTP